MKGATRPDILTLRSIAESQGGFFTASQAKSCRISPGLCSYHVGAGRFIRVRRGLYRLGEEFRSEISPIYAGWLGLALPSAFVSHESALLLHGLIASAPLKVHLTVERRSRKKPPPGVTLHTVLRLPPGHQLSQLKGLPVTSPGRSIIDCAASGMDTVLWATAVEAALSRRLSTRTELLFLAQERGGKVRSAVRKAVGGNGGGEPPRIVISRDR